MSNQSYQQSYNDILISTDKSTLNINMIHQFLSIKSYWAGGIPKATVERAIDYSICFGVYRNSTQIGFARVTSDRATFAYLADVFIVEEEQGKGLGKLLMQTIHQHPDLQGLRRWMLATRDAHKLYEKFDWVNVDDVAASRLMQILKPNIYKENQ